MQLSVNHVGQTKTPVICIDEFFPFPETLIKEASSDPPFVRDPTNFYPGKRKPSLNENYRLQLKKLVGEVIKDYFPSVKTLKADIPLVAFSLANMPASQLRPIQTIPHIDTHDELSFACVHYLCSEKYGGTSFYRHKATELERITSDKMKMYFAQAKQEVMSAEHKHGYCNGDTAFYKCIHSTSLQFNRLVVYPSNLLHSGNIDESLLRSSDVELGRLTLNSFFRYS